MRLSRGAWVRPNEDDAANAGRRLFLDAVAELYPDVLRELRAMLPMYRGGDEEDLRTAWTAWQVKWRLYDLWVAETAESTMQTWALPSFVGGQPEPAVPLALTQAERDALWARWWHPAAPDFKIIVVKEEDRPRAWSPQTESWEEYVQHLERHYRPPFEDRLRGAGLQPAHEVRGRAGAPADLHFRWLARYQVGREPHAAIAAAPDPRTQRRCVHVKTVEDALRGKRRLIGLSHPLPN